MKIVRGFVQELPSLMDYGWGTTMVVSGLTYTHAQKQHCTIGPVALLDNVFSGVSGGVPYVAGFMVTTHGLLAWNSRSYLQREAVPLNGTDNIPLPEAIAAHPEDEYRISLGLVDPSTVHVRVQSQHFLYLGWYAPGVFASAQVEPPISCRVGELPANHRDFLSRNGVNITLPLGSEARYK